MLIDRPYSRLVTLVLSLIFIALLLLLFNPFSRSEQLSQLRYIGESAGRMMDRHLEFYAGYESVNRAERYLHRFLFGERADVEAETIRTYEEVLDYFARHPQQATSWSLLNTQARLLIVLAETGRHELLRQRLQAYDDSPEMELIAEAIRYAYLGESSEERLPEIMYGARMLPLGWAADRLWLRIAERRGDQLALDYFKQRHLGNGSRQRQQVLILSLVVALVIIGGLYLLWHYRTLLATIVWRQQPIHWSLDQGYALAIRAAVSGLVIMLLVQFGATQYFRPGILASWSTLFASLPMLYLLHRHFAPGSGFRSVFGLSLDGVGWKAFLVICLGFTAIDWLGSMFISWGSWSLGVSSHWSEAVNERFIFGPSLTLWLGMINLVVFAAVFEELGFRGLVYNTMRSRLSARAAIIVSALLFSSVHLYSLAGFLSVLWSGLVLAYVYERYRSLLPGMVVHALGNLFSYGTVLLFYT